MLPVDNFPAWSCKVAAARHQGNENLIVVCMNNYDDNIIILDHKGTPGDISDDEYRIFSAIRDSAGQLSEFARINNIVEDPVTGQMLLSTIERHLFSIRVRNSQTGICPAGLCVLTVGKPVTSSPMHVM